MHIRPLRTPEDHQAALKKASAYFKNEPPAGTPEGDQFEILLALIDAYETEHHLVPTPESIEGAKS